MRFLLAAPLATLLLAAAVPAPAAEPAAATQLARVLMPKATWSRGLDELGQTVQYRMTAHPGKNLQYPPDFKDKVRGELEKVLPYDDLVAMHAKELAAAYTPAELDGLLAFYSAPLGQKSLEANPKVSDKVSQATQQRVESKMGDVMKRLSEHAKAPAGGAKQGASPHGGAAQGGASLPAGHPPMGGTAPAPAKKASTPPAKKASAPATKTAIPPAPAADSATPAK